MQDSASKLRVVAGAFLIAAGAALWFAGQSRDTARTQAFFDRMDDDATLRALSRETRNVRSEVLRIALERPNRIDPHSLSVALSQVDRAEARALYEEAMRPVMQPGLGPRAFRLAFDLVQRWDVTVDASMAVQLAREMQADPDPQGLGLLSGALRTVAPRLDASAAREVADALVQRMLVEKDPYALRSFDEVLAALPEFDGAALANRLLDAAQSNLDLAGVDSLLRGARALHDTPAVRSRAAAMLAGRAHAGLPVEALTGIALAMGDLSEDPAQLTQVARLLTDHLTETRDPYPLAVAASGLLAVGPGVPLPDALPLATRIGDRVLDESDPAALVRLALALHGVSHGWSDAQAAAFARQVLAEMERPRGSGRLRLYAVAMHAVADRAPEDVMEQARSLVRSRGTGEPLRMSLLALGEEGAEDEPEVEPIGDVDPLLLLDPTLPEAEWNRIALTVTGAEQADEDPSLEALAGVEDDDGDTDETTGVHVDFNALSDALDKVRPARAEASLPLTRTASVALMLLGVALLAFTFRPRR